MDNIESKSEGRAAARWATLAEANALVAVRTGKPGGVDPALWFKGDPPDAFYALGRIPLRAFSPNEADDRYDGTVAMSRAVVYARMRTAAPPVIALLSRSGEQMRILDGGHRITAARLRGDLDILALVRFKPAQLRSMSEEGGLAAIERMGWTVDMPIPMSFPLARLEELTASI